MKLFFYIFTATILCSSCGNKTQKETKTTQHKSPEIDRQEIIEKVKKHPITSSITAGEVIEGLAGEEGIASWQFFQPQEYVNNNDMLGIVGSTESNLFGTNLSFRIAYLYQISSGKIVYYAGFMNEQAIDEIEFISSLEQKKMLGL